jgi:hypothetical protein
MQGVWSVALLVLLGCRGPEVLPLAEPDEQELPETREPQPEPEVPVAREGSAGAAPAEEGPPLAAGGAGSGTSDCQAQPVTLREVHSGQVRPNFAVSLGELSATSQKFLLSEAKSGSCLWGAFAADPERTGPGSGLFLVSFGAPHEAGQACQSGSDGLPDDLAPGDRLAVQGFLSAYVPSACANATAAQAQLRIDAGCPAQRVGRGPAPSAERITPAIADALAAGTDVELLRAYSGALVELASVSVRQDPDDGDGVFPFGVVRLAETALELHSRIYYYDLAGGGPRAPAKAPAFAFPTEFESARGIVFLDYCTWALGPRDRCLDLSSASGECSP